MGRERRDVIQDDRSSGAAERGAEREQGEGGQQAPLNMQGAEGGDQTWRGMGNLIGAPPVKDEGDQPNNKPPNRGIVEDQAVYEQRRGAAEASLTLQRQRADAMLNGGYGKLDNRYWFSKVYSLVTENELLEAQNRTFYYPSYVMQSVRYFEKIYEDNIHAKDQTREVEEHWQEAFRVASDQGTQFLSDPLDAVTGGLYRQVLSLVTSMQAHIRYDLPRAEAWVFNSYYADMENASINDFAEDFNAMMGVFERAGAVMNEEINQHNVIDGGTMLPRLAQDTAMSLWFDADMGTERADTWERARLLVEEGRAGADPYRDDGTSGPLTGDVTTEDNMSQLQEISDPNLRPSMESSADIESDSQIRGDLSSMTDAEVAALPVGDRIRKIRRMLSGATFNADENSIIRILNVSTDIVSLVDGANAWDILYDTNGDEYGQVRTIFREKYYGDMSMTVAMTYIRRCIDGVTTEFQDEMIVDIMEARKTAGDSTEVLEELGLIYEGVRNASQGKLKIQWQIDGADQTRFDNLFSDIQDASSNFGDTLIREQVDGAGSGEIEALTVEERVAMLRRLMQGATLNADENTILTLLNKSKDAGDHVAVLNQIDAWKLAKEVHGAEWTQLKAFYKSHYYNQTDINSAFKLVISCLNGLTDEWEEEMVADLCCNRSDGRALVTKVGQYYEGGGFTEGLIKLEWQLDGADQRRFKDKFGSSGYWFADAAIRDRVNNMGPGALQQLGTNEKAAMIGRLNEGATGNADEDVILKLLRVSRSKGDLVAVIDSVGAYTLAQNMHGQQWTATKAIFKRNYYTQTSQGTCFDLIRFCFDGKTDEWEEEMVADILVSRKSKDGRQLVSRIGRHYEGGGFTDGLNKVEWQLDGADQDRVERAYGTSGTFW